MKLCRREWRTFNFVTLYLPSPCLALNKIMFSIQIVQKYLPSLLAITAGKFSKISKVCRYQSWFYEKFNIPTYRNVSSVFFQPQGVLLSSYFLLVLHKIKLNTDIY